MSSTLKYDPDDKSLNNILIYFPIFWVILICLIVLAASNWSWKNVFEYTIAMVRVWYWSRVGWAAQIQRILQLFNEAYAARVDERVRAQAPLPLEYTNRGRTQLLRYRHRPLASSKHIRLIVLLPSPPGQVKCLLEEVDLQQSNQRYSTISYSWDSDERFVDCEERYLGIPRNLFECLLYLVPSEGVVYLWADALCIDQNEQDEKSFQIPLMGKIYRRSGCCIVWLGNHTAQDALALALLDTLYLASIDERDRSRGFGTFARALDHNGTEAVTQKRCRTLGNQYRKRELLLPGASITRQFLTSRVRWKALEQLLGRTWFQRMWIFQEAILPTNLSMKCGQLDMPGNVFYGALDYVNEQNLAECMPSLPFGYFASLKISELRAGHRPSFGADLLDVFRDTRDRMSSNPRDKVFGTQGLWQQVHRRNLNLSYRATTVELYSEVAVYILQTHHNPLRLLYAAVAPGTDDNPIAGLPSWIPNWIDRKPVSHTMDRFEKTRRFSAGGRLDRSEYQILRDLNTGKPNRLRVCGKFLGSVKILSAMHGRENEREYALAYPASRSWQSKFHFVRNPSPYSEQKEPFEEFHGFMHDYLKPENWSSGENPVKPFPSQLQWYLRECLCLWTREADQDKFTAQQCESKTGDVSFSETHLWKLLGREGDISSDRGIYRTLCRWICNHFESYEPTLTPILADLQQWADERQLCVASAEGRNPVDSREYRGWVSLAATYDDQLFVIQGCDLPFMLRKVDNAVNEYQIVGHCYFMDIMQGQGMSNPSRQLQEIVLV